MFSVLMLYPHSHFKLGMDKININFMMLSNFLWGSGFGVEKCFEALHGFIYKGLQNYLLICPSIYRFFRFDDLLLHHLAGDKYESYPLSFLIQLEFWYPRNICSAIQNLLLLIVA